MDDTEKQGKQKRGKGLVLGIISVLVVALIGIGLYLYIVGPNTNVYLRFIDNYSSKALLALEKMDVAGKREATFETSASINGTGEYAKEYGKLLNNVKIKTKIQSDYNNKKINGNVELFYNNSSTIDGNIYINNNDIYIGIESLYNKLIKVPSDEAFNLEEFWQGANQKEYAVIVKEVTKILKNNLKEEYFSTSDEKIEVLGKEENVLKQTLTLTYKDEKELEKGIKNDILNNESLLNSLSKVSNASVEEIKKSLAETEQMDEYIEVQGSDEDVFLLIETYINKKDRSVEKATIKQDASVTEIVKTANGIYDIKNNDTKVGTLSVSNDELKITFEYGYFVGSLSIKENEINFNGEVFSIKFNVSVKGDEEKGTIVFGMKYPDYEITLNTDYTVKNIKGVDTVDYSNYIDYDKLTDDDKNSILTKVYQNKNLTTMIQDINSQYQ